MKDSEPRIGTLLWAEKQYEKPKKPDKDLYKELFEKVGKDRTLRINRKLRFNGKTLRINGKKFSVSKFKLVRLLYPSHCLSSKYLEIEIKKFQEKKGKEKRFFKPVINKLVSRTNEFLEKWEFPYKIQMVNGKYTLAKLFEDDRW